MRPRIHRDPTLVGTYPLSKTLILVFDVLKKDIQDVYSYGKWSSYPYAPCVSPKACYRNVDASCVLENVFRGGYCLEAVRVNHRNRRSAQVSLLLNQDSGDTNDVPVVLDDLVDLLGTYLFEVRVRVGLSFSTLCFYSPCSEPNMSGEYELDFEDGQIVVADNTLEYPVWEEEYAGVVQ